jgi:hypothetical protein
VTVEQIKEELLPKYSQDWRATVVTLDALAEGVKRELKTRFGHPGLNPHSDGFDFQL